MLRRICLFLTTFYYFCSVLEMSSARKLSESSKGVFFFQNKLKFLQKATLISDETLFSGQPPLSGHLPLPLGWTPYRAGFFYMEIKIV